MISVLPMKLVKLVIIRVNASRSSLDLCTECQALKLFTSVCVSFSIKNLTLILTIPSQEFDDIFWVFEMDDWKKQRGGYRRKMRLEMLVKLGYGALMLRSTHQHLFPFRQTSGTVKISFASQNRISGKCHAAIIPTKEPREHCAVLGANIGHRSSSCVGFVRSLN